MSSPPEKPTTEDPRKRPIIDMLIRRMLAGGNPEGAAIILWRAEQLQEGVDDAVGYTLNGRDASLDLVRSLVDGLLYLEQLKMEIEVGSDEAAQMRKISVISQLAPLETNLVLALETARRAHHLLWGRTTSAERIEDPFVTFAEIARERERERKRKKRLQKKAMHAADAEPEVLEEPRRPKKPFIDVREPKLPSPEDFKKKGKK